MRPSSSKKKHSKRKQGSSVRSRVIGNDLMLVGVNAVTKTLEKEPLLLVMVRDKLLLLIEIIYAFVYFYGFSRQFHF